MDMNNDWGSLRNILQNYIRNIFAILLNRDVSTIDRLKTEFSEKRPNERMDIVKIISEDLNANIQKLTVKTFDGIFNAKVNVYVSHVDDIKKICTEALKINGIERAARINEHDI